MKPIPGYDGYFVDEIGQVFSARRSELKQLRPIANTHGYFEVNLSVGNGKFRRVGVHVVVLLTFKGPAPPGTETRHLNGKRRDNCPDNLEWGTRKEQQEDRKRHGTLNYPKPRVLLGGNAGERNGQAKLTQESVLSIRRLAADLVSPKEIASQFRIHVGTVHQIVRRKRWQHIKGE